MRPTSPSRTLASTTLGCFLFALSASASGTEERIHRGGFLSAVDIPLGGLGGSVIRMNGKAERPWWQIFGNHETRPGSGLVPNSFFAIRTRQDNKTVVKALQTSAMGPFESMTSLSLRSTFPFARYDFEDVSLPVRVSLEAYSFLIPMNLRDSAIPAAVFRFTVSNPGPSTVETALLATQQNAAGFDGYGKIQGPQQRSFPGYGDNQNHIVPGKDCTTLEMTGGKHSLTLALHSDEVTATAAWDNTQSLFDDFAQDGTLSGPPHARSPQAGETIDGALARRFALKPGESQTLTFVLTWHIPETNSGTPGSKRWDFTKAGNQYENWWKNAAEVNREVLARFAELDGKTRLYRDTLYGGTLPYFLTDRLSSNLSVLKSPTSFWTKSGYFGLWESTSSKEEWLGNCKHVYHYAQSHARLFPSLARQLRKQDLDSAIHGGFLPARDGDEVDALDGHFGATIAVYREHLLSPDLTFLKNAWPQTRMAMEYAITTYDPDHDGMLSGSYHNTLDCNSSGTSTWSGSLYLAALKACARMATEMSEKDTAERYGEIFETGRKNQNTQLWNEELGYYIEKPQNLPNTRTMDKGAPLDMFLGQWWANQLNLGPIYPDDRTRTALAKIYQNNRITDDGTYKTRYRDFLGKGDTGWKMLSFPGPLPKAYINYHDEVMSGFEYSMAATLIQCGMVDQGLDVIRAIFNRYDGRLRAKDEVRIAPNATVFGTGSPVGEDECGDFYGRAMSSWSALLALQGFQCDGPRGILGFKPLWQPDNHRSFFSSAEGWGLFSQQRDTTQQSTSIQLRYGTLRLHELVLALPPGHTHAKTLIKARGRELQASVTTSRDEIRIAFPTPLTLLPGEELTVTFDLQPAR